MTREAQTTLKEKIAIDINHVVGALEAIWNEVGYSAEERRLQMDKLSDELTQTLRAKLACEVEVREVFKKDIEMKSYECEELCVALGVDGVDLQVADLRLSHGLMRLEEEQAKLDSLKCDRLLLFESARADMEQLCEMLSEPLERRYEVGHEDLTERRLATFAARIAQLRELEEKRAAHVASLGDLARTLQAELYDSESLCGASSHGEEVRDVRDDAEQRAERRLQSLKDEKNSRLKRLSLLGDEISLLWERLDVHADAQRKFREVVKESAISHKTFAAGEAELAKLRLELRDRVGDLVQQRRTRMTQLWDEMDVHQEQRKTFVPFFADVAELDESALTEHEEKLAELEQRRTALQPILKLCERREELIEERLKMEMLQADPSRLTRRGPGAAAERKYEMEAERRLKLLPRISEKLIKAIGEWERIQGDFLWKGSRYVERIRETDAAWDQHKADLKHAAAAKKLSLKEHNGE